MTRRDLLISVPVLARAQSGHRIQRLRIQVLSTMLVSDLNTTGEWGFAAIIDADGHRILFDTGGHPDTVLHNARELGIDLSGVTDVVLSHHHADHTAGLLTLRKKAMAVNSRALSRVHAARGIFWSGTGTRESPAAAPAIRQAYEQTRGKFIEYDKPVELFPAMWLTGPVPRKYPERNWSTSGRVKTPQGMVEDDIPEDTTAVFDTDRGLVVLSGCGHAGIVNTIEYATSVVRKAPVHAAIGGFHLFPLDDEKLNWTADKLRGFGLENFLGVHCTGIEATYRIRERAGLGRKTCAAGAVGATFELGKGLKPGVIAQ